MKIKTVIIDDEDLAADFMERLLLNYDDIEIIGKYYSSNDALKAIELLSPDLIFSDIQMPKLTGVELVKKLNYNPLIIFTTAFSEYAIDAYNLNVLDYLVKPISVERLQKAVEKAIVQFQLQTYSNLIVQNEQYILLKKDGIEHRVNYTDILYIEGLKQYAMVYTSSEKFYLNETLKKLEVEFIPHGFVRVHKSFIVNKRKIEKRKALSLFIIKKEIPIGRSYKEFDV
jgi:DNA-binding LytR/AlgR family response regulator